MLRMVENGKCQSLFIAPLMMFNIYMEDDKSIPSCDLHSIEAHKLVDQEDPSHVEELIYALNDD
jgi:hypothetical protein